MSIRQLYKKYKDVIPYLFFGICTTIVNVIVYWVVAHPLGISMMQATILAWLLAVLFAYITNRKWVFQSEVRGNKEIIKEIGYFFACRLATGALDWLCMLVFVDLLSWNDVIVKFSANVLVIILNYVASRLLIFKKKE